jgi:hypothetical protein
MYVPDRTPTRHQLLDLLGNERSVDAGPRVPRYWPRCRILRITRAPHLAYERAQATGSRLRDGAGRCGTP